ncbi:uncharacterized protein LOC143213352 [Lasioglossum baleicum]|uniref:uncharacterized protein LOC143213352 n=1 Tax=Lasioglossum baleicum TaxID=434251 RepID=UPI003FCE29C8
MRLLHRSCIFFLIVGLGHNIMSSENEASCDCEQCNGDAENDVEETDKIAKIPALYKEDRDGDGNRTICARDREFNDRTFPSVCHMLCYNRCLILRLSTVTENGLQKNIVIAYRNNYYKLRDGEC